MTDITDEMIEAGVAAVVALGCGPDGCDPECSCREFDDEAKADFQRMVRTALEGALAGRVVVDLPEPDEERTGEDPTAGWDVRTSERPRRGIAVSAALGEGWQPEIWLQTIGKPWEGVHDRGTVMRKALLAGLAACDWAEKKAAEQSSGVAGGDTR